MKNLIIPVLSSCFLLLASTACSERASTTGKQVVLPSEISISKDKLMDKIKGGWAGQTMVVHTEGRRSFVCNGSGDQDYVLLSGRTGI